MPPISIVTANLGLLLAAGSAAYAVIAAAVVRRRRVASSPNATRPVSVLKPLCGAEPQLYENLRSFCEQNHPCFQIVCGIREAGDPAGAVVERLQREFPQIEIALVCDARVYGTNLKISNLINLLPSARHDWLVLADSDIAVAPDYLRRVTAPLADPAVGIVTCLYRGRPLGGLWSRLGAMFIDEWFVPSVRVAHRFGSQAFGFGATLALSRETLAAIGGFAPLADLLADDWWLAQRSRRLGLRTVLSEVVVQTDVVEDNLAALWVHELRWLRTVRSVAPAGYAFSFFSVPLPVAVVGAWLAGGGPAAVLLAATVAARLVIHYRQRLQAPERSWTEIFLVPLRDLLTLAAWSAGLLGRRVLWRKQQFAIHTPHAAAPAAPIPREKSDKR